MMSEEVYTKALVRMNCITTRTDAAERSEYTDLPFMAEAADMLNGTNFRPLNEKYPSVSTCIQSMVESVVSGTKPEEAMAQYAVDVDNCWKRKCGREIMRQGHLLEKSKCPYLVREVWR